MGCSMVQSIRSCRPSSSWSMMTTQAKNSLYSDQYDATRFSVSTSNRLNGHSRRFHGPSRRFSSDSNKLSEDKNGPVFTIEGSIAEGKLEVGSYAQVSHVFTQEDVTKFANLCGDNNPLHIDPIFAEKTMFKGTIVHGILVSSLFSTIFGRCINGAVYVSQTLAFKRPVHAGTEIIAKIEIQEIQMKKQKKLLLCTSRCFIKSTQELAVDGEARVLAP